MSMVTRVDVEGFMALISGAVDLDGVTEISGPNGSGKTSMLTAIHVGVDGADAARDVTDPVHHDAERATVRLKLDDGTTAVRIIERKPGGGHTWKIVLEPADGGRGKTITQRQLHELVGEHRLDPMDFLNLKPADKFAALQSFVPGVDFAKSVAEDDADFKKRTDLNRDAKNARAAADLITVPGDTPAEAIDEAALLQELQDAHAKNGVAEKRRTNREALRNEISEMRARAQAITDGIPGAVAARVKLATNQIADFKEQIATLERRILQATTDCITDEGTIARERNDESAVLVQSADSQQKRLDEAEALPTPIDTEALAQQIKDAKAVNTNVARRAERTAHNQKAATYEHEADALTAAMAERRKAREAAIAAAAIPIKGIEFGPGVVRLHGVPFDEASKGQQFKAAFEYCIGCNPKLRVMWIRDASLLDDTAFAEVNRLAEEFKVRVLLETVRPIGSNVVILEAGRVKEVRRRKAVAA